MIYSDIITLIAEKTEQDADGYKTTTETKTEIYANVKSAKRSEFYEALRSGMSVVIAFDVFAHDYDGQRLIEYNDRRYQVERAFQTQMDRLELNCSEVRRQ